jgi:hypothetical protein
MLKDLLGYHSPAVTVALFVSKSKDNFEFI